MFDVQPVRAELAGGSTAVRTLGAGRPVLMLHGYPETHVCWHRVAGPLGVDHSLVMPDLPGYGDSDVEAIDDAAFSKRSMATAMVELMAQLGHERFDVVGHDRGGRVAYRMALDHPDVVTSLTVIDIVPTIEEWELFDAPESIATFHWPFLAQGGGLPEALLAGAPDRWIEFLFESWTADVEPIAPECMEEYRRCFRRPEVIAGTCADYRAGATVDWDHDREDRAAGRMISCPMLALSSAGRGDLGSTWRRWATNVRSACIEGGHFLPEENPAAVLDHLIPFLA